MDSKDRKLLLRDLAGRITHGVKVEVTEDGLIKEGLAIDAAKSHVYEFIE